MEQVVVKIDNLVKRYKELIDWIIFHWRFERGRFLGC